MEISGTSITDPNLDFAYPGSQIPDQGVKKALNPGSGFTTLMDSVPLKKLDPPVDSPVEIRVKDKYKTLVLLSNIP